MLQDSSILSFWTNLLKKIQTFLRSSKFVNFSSKRNKHQSFNLDALIKSNSFAAMRVSNQLEQVFKVFDTNGDGKISSHELSTVLLCFGCYDELKTANMEAERIVKAMDVNGDGFIDLDEFMVVMNPEGKFGSKEKEEDYVLMDAFLIFDIDKNGLISAKELKKIMLKLGFSKCSVQDCKKMIKRVDRDGDGFVGFEEFRFMMTGRVGKSKP